MGRTLIKELTAVSDRRPVSDLQGIKMFKRGYQDLHVWQKAMDFVDVIYESSRGFPKKELYGLTSQLRRSSVSIPSNLAEGCTRSSTREFIRFAEVETQLVIACRQQYLLQERLDALMEMAAEIGRMINGLLQSLKQRVNATTTGRQPLAAVNS